MSRVDPLVASELEIEGGGVRYINTRAHRKPHLGREHEAIQVDDPVVDGLPYIPRGRTRIEETILCVVSADKLGCSPGLIDHCDIRHSQPEIADIAISTTIQSDKVAFELLCVNAAKDDTAVLAKIGQVKAVKT